MSKEASVIQKHNAKTREYEYFVKGYDITESIKNLLKLHKEAYDKENHSILETKGFIEAQNIYLPRIQNLEHRLSNCIEPKFKIGQTIYTFNKYQNRVYTLYVVSIHIEQYETTEFNNLVYRTRRLEDGFIGGYLENELFATEEEAKAKLEELKNG